MSFLNAPKSPPTTQATPPAAPPEPSPQQPQAPAFDAASHLGHNPALAATPHYAGLFGGIVSDVMAKLGGQVSAAMVAPIVRGFLDMVLAKVATPLETMATAQKDAIDQYVSDHVWETISQFAQGMEQGTPTTPPQRMNAPAEATTGFLATAPTEPPAPDQPQP